MSKWQLKAPLAPVWNAIYESEYWPTWWKGVLNVDELVKGDECGLGSIRSYTLSSPTHYKLSFNLLLTGYEQYSRLEGTASGDLEGTGAWYFREEQGITYVECRWEVATTIGWMNSFAFLLAPVFRYNHKKVMQWGARSLARKLNATLLKC